MQALVASMSLLQHFRGLSKQTNSGTAIQMIHKQIYRGQTTYYWPLVKLFVPTPFWNRMIHLILKIWAPYQFHLNQSLITRGGSGRDPHQKRTYITLYRLLFVLRHFSSACSAIFHSSPKILAPKSQASASFVILLRTQNQLQSVSNVFVCFYFFFCAVIASCSTFKCTSLIHEIFSRLSAFSVAPLVFYFIFELGIVIWINTSLNFIYFFFSTVVSCRSF